jgi:hypothetical protein
MTRLGLFVLLVASLGLSACGAGQVFGATITPSPTETRTPGTTPTSTLTFTPSSTPTPTSTPTPAVYDIFNTNSFPAVMKAVAMDPMKATPEQQAEYQTFLDAQREKYFETEGIKDVVDKMVESGQIDPRQRGLWGLVYDQAIHQERRGLMVFSPQEIREAVAAEDQNNFPLYYEKVSMDGHNFMWPFGFDNQLLSLDPQYQKISPFGVDVPAIKAPMFTSGFLVGVGTVDTNPDARILEMAMKKPDGQWRLIYRSASHQPSFNIPNGASCMVVGLTGPSVPMTYPEAIPVGPLTYFGGGTFLEATDEYLLSQLGFSIDISFESNLQRNWERSNGTSTIFCNYPYGIFMAEDISRSGGGAPGYLIGDNPGYYRSWPWLVGPVK